jgi:response regulator RpfG family c-di-GMP phosphodiesterase
MVLRQTTRISMTRAIRCDGLLEQLIERGVVHPEEWAELGPDAQRAVAGRVTLDELLAELETRCLLTRYQADRVRAGRIEDLTLSQYRLVEPIGRGGMGVVYRAEHIHLRRPVAIKVLMSATEMSPTLLQRFFAEARAISRLRHPNIVGCLDAGWAEALGPSDPVKYFYVMEYVPGQDLQTYVREQGPMPPGSACAVIRDCAEALVEAHRAGLIHRDIKPSNVMIGLDGHPYVLDFGLAKLPNNQLTEPGTLLGTLGYMAPEQATDAAAVDHRADIFALGATLYWALTREDPFPITGNLFADLARRNTIGTPSVRAARPDISPDLDRVIAKMLAPEPADRYQSMALVSLALRPFARRRSAAPEPARVAGPVKLPQPDRQTVLIVDDDSGCRALCRALTAPLARTLEAADEAQAIAILDAEPVDLVILDFQLQDGTTAGLLNNIRGREVVPPVGVLLISGAASYDLMSGMLAGGADDYLLKPYDFEDFRARVRALLHRRDEARAAAGPTSHHDDTPSALISLTADLRSGLADVLALTLEEGGLRGRGFHVRMPEYVRILAEALPPGPDRSSIYISNGLEAITFAALAHDVGMLLVPHEMVLKPGKLTDDERLVVQSHTALGHQLLTALAKKRPALAPLLTLAADVALAHHEWFDGTGYPHLTAGTEVSFPARFVGLLSVYDALRTRKPFRPALTHPAAVQRITELAGKQFDPQLVEVFGRCAAALGRISQQPSS